MAGFWCFWACWESFVPVGPGGGRAGRVLYRLGQGAAVAGRVFYRVSGGLVVEPGKSSPCSVSWWLNREKVLPARLKWPDFGVFGRAGRVLYRLGQGTAVAGRVLYRLGIEVGVAWRVLYRVSQGAAVVGRVLYRVSGGLVLEAGENSPCSVSWWLNREKTLPAREKWPDFVDCGRAGRVLYRLGLEAGVLGEFCTG